MLLVAKLFWSNNANVIENIYLVDKILLQLNLSIFQ